MTTLLTRRGDGRERSTGPSDRPDCKETELACRPRSQPLEAVQDYEETGSRKKCPLLPPDFSNSRMPEIDMLRSMDLHMS